MKGRQDVTVKMILRQFRDAVMDDMKGFYPYTMTSLAVRKCM